MRYPVLFVLLSAALAAAAPLAYGVGSGGGGGAAPCAADLWDCGEWGACGAGGTQSRTCTKTFDCPAADTPSPAAAENCTPPASGSGSDSGASSAGAACKEDVWQCGGWNQCDRDGNQSRTCAKQAECAGAETPSPETGRRCAGLQCGNKATLRERVSCRLELSPAGMARELELQYLPEECRALSGYEAQEKCEERYQSFKSCWNIGPGAGRFTCARTALKLGPVMSDAVKGCQDKRGSEQVACKAEVREQAYDMIKFRFYDLGQRAEALKEHGVDAALIADFVTRAEEQKQVFNAARTKEERRNVIARVREAWQSFVQEAKKQYQP